MTVQVDDWVRLPPDGGPPWWRVVQVMDDHEDPQRWPLNAAVLHRRHPSGVREARVVSLAFLEDSRAVTVIPASAG